MPYLQFDRFRMHYEIHRNLVPVDTLLIHGNLGSNAWWDPAVDAWEARSRTFRREEGCLVVAEWRGCGKSTGPQNEAELEFSVLANDYIELLLSLGISKANVIGHSTGGLIGLHAMKQAPEIFQRAVLLDPVSARGIEVSPGMQASFLAMSRDRELLKKSLHRTIHHNSPDSPYFEAIVDAASKAHPMIWAGILKKLSQVQFTESLKEIRQPTLVLHGEHDVVLPMAGSMEIAKLLPEGRFQMLTNHGHSCLIENPALFVEIAHQFLFG